MKKETVIVVSAGAAVGLAAIFLMLLGNHIHGFYQRAKKGV